MKRLVLGVLAVGAGIHGQAQTKLDLRTQTRSVDFAGASSTRPVKTGPTTPAACSTGDLFFKSDAVAGRNLYGCTQPNIWMPLTGAIPVSSGCGLTGCETGLCSIDSHIIPSYTDTLNNGAVIVGGGESYLRALNAGTAGQVLTSNGPGADPSWINWQGPAGHAALAGLDYASSGHTGFEPALGFAPERQLSFSAPLARNGDTISCPTCASGGAKYAVAFASSMSVSVAGADHQRGADIRVTVWDGGSPRKTVEPDTATVDTVTGDLTVTFAVPQSGWLVVE